jgi:4-hydroxy-3-methylbut-2-en-1-yl diphosphate reductase
VVSRILLASPRGYCAGVERAIDTVHEALRIHGAPVYVRKQIVHNIHVVRALEAKGAVFVDDESQIPAGGVCVFSAHGVSPAVRRNAAERRLAVIDATCPLVTKVHVEARRFAGENSTIFLIGHEGHEEVVGTTGEAPDRTVLIQTPEEARMVRVPDDTNVAYLTQTTLSVDETNEIIDVLRERFPTIRGPGREDICYATQNRQDAVKELADQADVVLVIGSPNSSNSRRLVEVARSSGTPAHLIDDESEIDPDWMASARTVGVTSGASAPEWLVERVVDRLCAMGGNAVERVHTIDETLRFSLPAAVR